MRDAESRLQDWLPHVLLKAKGLHLRLQDCSSCLGASRRAAGPSLLSCPLTWTCHLGTHPRGSHSWGPPQLAGSLLTGSPQHD